MPVSPADLLALAKKLAGDPTECEWRTSVSRSYYAAVHVAIVVADDTSLRRHIVDPESFTGMGFAARLVKAFTWDRAPNSVKSAGYVLEQLRKQRVAADYIVDASFRQSQAEQAIALAQKAIDKLTAIRTLP